MGEAREIAAGLSEAQRRILLEAELADSHEFWLHEDIGDQRLAYDDLVVTSLGLQVRQVLQERQDATDWTGCEGCC